MKAFDFVEIWWIAAEVGKMAILQWKRALGGDSGLVQRMQTRLMVCRYDMHFESGETIHECLRKSHACKLKTTKSSRSRRSHTHIPEPLITILRRKSGAATHSPPAKDTPALGTTTAMMTRYFCQTELLQGKRRGPSPGSLSGSF